MNYKEALGDDRDIVEHKGIKIFGISLMIWVLAGLLMIAGAAYLSADITQTAW